MAKMNANTASREQLVEAGIRAELADAILKLRRKEKITSLAALIQLPGNGPFTHARLRSLLDFTDQADEPTRETAEALRSATRAGTEATTAEAVRSDLLTVRRAAGAAGVVAHRSPEGTTELGRALTNLMQEQVRHNFETWTALTSATDWEQVFQIHREYLRVSLERAAQLTQRCLEAARTGMIAVANTARDQVENAA